MSGFVGKVFSLGLSIPYPNLEGSGMMNPTRILTPDDVKLLCHDQKSSVAKHFHFVVEWLSVGAS